MPYKDFCVSFEKEAQTDDNSLEKSSFKNKSYNNIDIPSGHDKKVISSTPNEFRHPRAYLAWNNSVKDWPASV